MLIAENLPGEAQEAKVKAVLTPTVLSKFFTDYNGHPIPPNLSTCFRERVTAALLGPFRVDDAVGRRRRRDYSM